LFLKQTEGVFEVNLDMVGDTDNPLWRNVISHYNRYNLVQYHCQLCKQLIAFLITTLSRGTYLADYRMLRPWFLISDLLWYVTPYAKDMQEVFQWSTENFFKLVRAHK
jgi:hypothetical protein